MTLNQSILTSVKGALGVTEADVSFDQEILMHINTAFATLNELGVGPDEGFAIEDKTVTWDALLGTDKRKNNVKTYTFLRVKFLFDPPATSFGITAVEKQIEQFEWRINTYREMTGWTDPTPPIILDDQDVLIDGGGA